jgi:hypothetical protein
MIQEVNIEVDGKEVVAAFDDEGLCTLHYTGTLSLQQVATAYLKAYDAYKMEILCLR